MSEKSIAALSLLRAGALSHKCTIEDVLSGEVLEDAYAWLCKRRRRYPDASDIWSFRRRWTQEKACLREDLAAGRYRFGVLSRVTLKTGEEVDISPARDALVLKALSLVLAQRLGISPKCCHLKGHGGSKRAARRGSPRRTDPIPCRSPCRGSSGRVRRVQTPEPSRF